jgi:hypothetical protein
MLRKSYKYNLVPNIDSDNIIEMVDCVSDNNIKLNKIKDFLKKKDFTYIDIPQEYINNIYDVYFNNKEIDEINISAKNNFAFKYALENKHFDLAVWLIVIGVEPTEEQLKIIDEYRKESNYLALLVVIMTIYFLFVCYYYGFSK